MNLKSLGRLPSTFVYHKMEIEGVYLVLLFCKIEGKELLINASFQSTPVSV